MNKLQTKFDDARAIVKECIIGREEEIDLVFLALAMKEHVLLIGPPGTGKSMLCNEVARAFEGITFSILANKYTEPDEVFGPISFKEMENDKRIRKTKGFMPEADLVFIDEIWKSSSSILNSMLTIMNERKFKQDSEWVDSQVKTIIGASNEYPIGRGYEGLWAAYDRFLLRKHVNNLSFDDRMEMAFAKSFKQAHQVLDMNDLNEAYKEIATVKFSKDVKQKLCKLFVDIDELTTCMTDRRTRKAVNAVKAQAWINGRYQVDVKDFDCLRHICWSDPKKERDVVQTLVFEMINYEIVEARKLEQEIDEILNPYEKENYTVDLTDTVVSDIRKMQDCAERAKPLGEHGKPLVQKLETAVLRMSQNVIRQPVSSEGV